MIERQNWAHLYLESNGYKVESEVYPIRIMPWSQVYALNTQQGKIYLKVMVPFFANEANLLQFLFKKISHRVPEVIGVNEALSCFLMKDNGMVLRDLLRVHYDQTLIHQSLEICADIQIASIPYVDELLSLKVNDWRLKNVTLLYQKFIAQEKLLLNDGLNKQEICELHALFPQFKQLCEALMILEIPQTLEHGDFHDNNILVQDHDLTINDWGDASITHPFLSCVAFLDSARRHHGLIENSEKYQVLVKAYLDRWRIFNDQKTLNRAFDGAKVLYHFIFALSFARIKLCEGIDAFPQYNGYIANSLKTLILKLK